MAPLLRSAAWLLAAVGLVQAADLTPSENGQFGRGRFYLDTDRDGQITANVAFNATYYTPATTVKWIFPDECTVTPVTPSNSIASVVCSQFVGRKPAAVYRDNDTTTADNFFIKSYKSNNCFRWYIDFPGLSNFNPSLYRPPYNFTARIWIYDPTKATVEERNGYAVAPSLASIQRTLEFQTLGETPVLTMPSSNGFTMLSQEFVQRYWNLRFSLRSIGMIPVDISSMNISSMSCQVSRFRTAMSIPRYQAPEAFSKYPSNLTAFQNSGSRQISISYSGCSPNLAVASSNAFPDLSFYFTQSGFIKSYATSADGLWTFSNRAAAVGRIVDAELTSDGFAFLTDNGAVLYTTNKTAIAPALGISPKAKPNKLWSALYCDGFLLPGMKPNPTNNLVIAVDSFDARYQNDTFSMYLSEDGGKQFRALPIPGLKRDIVAYTAVYQLVMDNYVILYDDPNKILTAAVVKKDGRITYSIQFTAEISMRSANSQCVPSMETTSSGVAEIAVWCDKLFISPNGGITFAKMELASRDPASNGRSLGAGDYVETVVTHPGGYLAALTKQRRIFFGRVEAPAMVELLSPLAPTSAATLYFDAVASLYTLEAILVNGVVAFNNLRIPAKTEIKGPRIPIDDNPEVDCPYIEYVSNVTSLSYLDLNDQLVVSTFIKAALEDDAQVSYSFANIALLNVSTSSKLERLRQLSTMERLVTLSPMGSAVGKAAVRITPNNVNLGCQEEEKISLIQLGCPPNRRIVVRGIPLPTDPTEEGQDCNQIMKSQSTQYELPAGVYYTDASWQTKSSTTKMLDYDVARYGCPMHQSFRVPFRPTLDLYDGDEWVQTIEADFVVWEVNLRSDFSYNASVSMVHCLSPPRRWQDAISKNSTDPFEAWTPTFDDCFSIGQPLNDDLNRQPYQILNNSGVNAIRWTRSNGMFIFQVKVIDASYSFCNLTAEFGVKVYGAPLPEATQLGILFGSMVLMLLVLAVSYLRYKADVTSVKQKVY